MLDLIKAALSGAGEGAQRYLSFIKWLIVGLGSLLVLLIVRDFLSFFKK